ncbi:hypothetical protein [Blochmannia endosymbiont of Camponotus nipponensis]|nr:hypothetical protein [Blochmannia endosymbiont of Camponotus nipponensis]
MLSFYSTRRLSISMRLFIASGLVRMLIVLVVLLCLWVAIFWSSLLP